jgi:hypothetical protein
VFRSSEIPANEVKENATNSVEFESSSRIFEVMFPFSSENLYKSTTITLEYFISYPMNVLLIDKAQLLEDARSEIFLTSDSVKNRNCEFGNNSFQ